MACSLFVVQFAGGQAILARSRAPADRLVVHRRKLGVAVVGEVAAGAIQLQPADVRRVHRLIAALEQFVLDEGLQQAAHDRPLRHPQDQAAADRLADGEQLELLAEHAVVALLRLFDLVQVGVEVLLAEEGGAVEALELLAAGVVLPVGAGDAAAA